MKKMRTAGLGLLLATWSITSGPPKKITSDPLLKRGMVPWKNLKCKTREKKNEDYIRDAFKKKKIYKCTTGLVMDVAGADNNKLMTVP